MPQSEQSQSDLVRIVAMLQELVEIVKDETKELERLAIRPEQQTDLRDEPRDLTVESSRLSALHQQVRSLRERMQAGSDAV